MDRALDVERETWQRVMAALRQAARLVKPTGRKCRYSHRLIVALYLWSVYHQACLSWACDRRHYGRLFRPRRLPSVSQFTRRIQSDSCQLLLQKVHELLADSGQALDGGYFDGKPLLVSPVSKDPDARRGHVSGGFAKGYKLHVYVTRQRRIVLWSLMPLNVAEQRVALALMEHLPPLLPLALNTADSNFDAAPLYKAHEQRGAGLLTPLKNQQRVRDGQHHPVTLRQMGQQRREAVQVWNEHPDLARYLLRERNNVEGVFSVLVTALNLQLPGSVRRLGRVRRWVGAKIILYHARLLAQEQAAA